MSAFMFNDKYVEEAGYRAELPAGITSKAALLDALAVNLRFPEYFGRNWDALWECICDLSWLPPGDVILSHRDLPLVGDRTLLPTYLSILCEAVENWNKAGSNLIFGSCANPNTCNKSELLMKRKLFVVFPPDTRNVVEGLLAS